jgi:hypothetical protein
MTSNGLAGDIATNDVIPAGVAQQVPVRPALLRIGLPGVPDGLILPVDHEGLKAPAGLLLYDRHRTGITTARFAQRLPAHRPLIAG